MIQMHRAEALAMLARFAEARAVIAELRAQLADQGSMIPYTLATGFVAVEIELLAGDPAAAAAFAEEGCRLLQEAGDRSWLSTVVGRLGLALYELDRLDDADAAAGRSAELGASDDAITQMLWRQARAKVLARRGCRGRAAGARSGRDRRHRPDARLAGRRPWGPRRGAHARRKGRRGRGRTPGGARPVRAQGQPRHGRAHEHETSRARRFVTIHASRLTVWRCGRASGGKAGRRVRNCAKDPRLPRGLSHRFVSNCDDIAGARPPHSGP